MNKPYYNPSVPIEQEIEEAKAWKVASRNSEKRAKRLIREWKAELIPPTTGKIDDTMIEKAKDFPIENLIEVVKGKARCLWHDDKNPSMSLKNNRVKCFVCNNKPQDSIAVYMKLYNTDFKSAVIALQ